MNRSKPLMIACRTLGFAFVLTFAWTTAATAAPPPGGNANCGLHTLKGRYAATISGWAGSGPGRVAYGATGSIYLDGRGNITGSAVQSIDGTIVPVSIVGTYTVDPETCTGDAVAPGFGTFFFAITENGKGTLIVGTTLGTTVTGQSIRQ